MVMNQTHAVDTFRQLTKQLYRSCITSAATPLACHPTISTGTGRALPPEYRAASSAATQNSLCEEEHNAVVTAVSTVHTAATTAVLSKE
jgi:hypothetical protein